MHFRPDIVFAFIGYSSLILAMKQSHLFPFSPTLFKSSNVFSSWVEVSLAYADQNDQDRKIRDTLDKYREKLEGYQT